MTDARNELDKKLVTLEAVQQRRLSQSDFGHVDVQMEENR